MTYEFKKCGIDHPVKAYKIYFSKNQLEFRDLETKLKSKFWKIIFNTKKLNEKKTETRKKKIYNVNIS